MSILKAVNALKQGETKSFRPLGNEVLIVTKNAIVLRVFRERNESLEQHILAVKVGDVIVGNSSALNISGRSNGLVQKEQLELSELVSMIPFSVIKQAGLDLGTYKEIDRGPDETIYRQVEESRISLAELKKLKENKTLKELGFISSMNYRNEAEYKVDYLSPQHFTGARLFEVDSRLFLLDVDRGELTHGIINPFLVELPVKVNTIIEAYESLKPDVVKDAEHQGLKVLRQGEWFLIPTTKQTNEMLKKLAQDKIDGEINKGGSISFAQQWANRGVLQAGQNRPNKVETMVEHDALHYVAGKLEHTGREHKELILKDFYLAVPNTATKSWTIVGDVD